ncbi:MAG: mannose-1-phosphate guanylyltransferase [Balneolaceae bacterium]|nr:mannose-1-phosphate guanylyltransferase [Balneolaceae bacterium]
MLHAIIMAGGSGTRFWPRSTRDRPKQFLRLFGERTMLQNTIDRLDPLIPSGRCWVVTNERYRELATNQVPDVPGDQVVGEPVARNTAPCVALAAALLLEKDPEATMAVLPADHLIGRPGEFRHILETAQKKVTANPDTLVTVGIRPDRPETGYGYIEFHDRASSREKISGQTVFEVLQFREKPDEATARAFLASGNFLWNSGMFVWKARTILEEFRRHMPQLGALLGPLQSALAEGRAEEGIASFYQACPSESIDYGIMEKSDSVHVVPGDFDWNDVGSWRAVYDLRPKDGEGNVLQTEHHALISSSGNLIQSESGKLVALVGMENTVVVETDRALLVCNLDRAQNVKQIVQQLEEDEETKQFL